MSELVGNRRGLILGGTCELALYLARVLIEKGAVPVLTWRSDDGLQRITNALDVYNERFETTRLDLSDAASIQEVFARSDSRFDFLVDFAQGDYEALIASSDESRFCTYFTENVAARAVVLKHICRQMLAWKQGRLVFVSSSAAGRPAPGQGFYSAAKLASEALYRNCGLELAAKGITAVILRAGYIDAGRGRAFLAANPETVRQVPLNRFLTTEEVAETILFLLSPAATGINATTVTMDGGLTAGKASPANPK
ncbi:MAG: SDR family oxidoreductase [Syntrophaceae bacterium]|nr:SDR family oxidoreductase [Syntrophaceae bacterium]